MHKKGWSHFMLRQKQGFSENAQYICRCETCGEVFFQTIITKLSETCIGLTPNDVADAVLSKDLSGFNPSFLWSKPQLWYIKAARHWVANKTHLINIVVEEEKAGFSEALVSLSSGWQRDLGYQPNQSDQAMLKELDHLEAQLK